MATYYLRVDGDDANTGLGQAAGQAWRTFRRAVSSTGIGSGDTLYIAPGDYRDMSGVIPVDGTYSTTTRIIGNPTGSQFSGVTAGRVLISNRTTSDVTFPGNIGTLISITLKSNLHFENLIFENASINGTILLLVNSTDLQFHKCIWAGTATQQNTAIAVANTGAYILASRNYLFSRCMLYPGSGGGYYDATSYAATGTNYDYNITLDRCVGFGINLQIGGVVGPRGIYMVNCESTSVSASNSKGNIIVKNCVNLWSSIRGGANMILTQGANTISTGNAVENTAYINFNSFTFTSYGTNYASPYNLQSVSENRLFGISPNYERSGYGVYLENAGTLTGTTVIPALAGQPGYSATGVPLTDFYGNPWSGNGTPHIGAYNDYSTTATGAYNPTERNASNITLASSSTSQSVELYLGVTGLTATTVGLSARYNKNRTVDVAIPLVARTITQPWVAGGFAEVNSTTMPGVYRLDIPNEAISTGYVNTTIVVRGASGTNGAVVTIQEPAPVGTQLRMGPFTVQADGILTDDRLKLIQGSVHSIDFKMVDAYGTGVDGTGTVVTAKVYNAAGFLIDTYTCTAMYALDGRYSFAIDSTVTDNVGMYTINIYRQIGTETNVFGRMKLEVLSP